MKEQKKLEREESKEVMEALEGEKEKEDSSKEYKEGEKVQRGTTTKGKKLKQRLITDFLNPSQESTKTTMREVEGESKGEEKVKGEDQEGEEGKKKKQEKEPIIIIPDSQLQIGKQLEGDQEKNEEGTKESGKDEM